MYLIAGTKFQSLQYVSSSQYYQNQCSNWNKPDWAALRFLSGPCRTIQLQQRHCQHSGPLTANTYSFLRMTYLAVDIVIHWKSTGRPPGCQQCKKKKKSVSMTTTVFKFSSHFCHRGWQTLAIITFFSIFPPPGSTLTHLLPTELSGVITTPNIILRVFPLLTHFPYLWYPYMAQTCTSRSETQLMGLKCICLGREMSCSKMYQKSLEICIYCGNNISKGFVLSSVLLKHLLNVA